MTERLEDSEACLSCGHTGRELDGGGWCSKCRYVEMIRAPFRSCIEELEADLKSATASYRKVLDSLRAIEVLHVSDTDAPTLCVRCRALWPCRTFQIASSALRGSVSKEVTE